MQAEAIHTYLSTFGGSLLNAIAVQPDLDVPALWQELARSQDRLFIGALRDASPLEAHLLTRDMATQYLVLGHVLELQTVRLITPNPFLSSTSLQPLREALRSKVPGGAFTLPRVRLEVCPPQLWKTIYDLSYPVTPYTPPLSEAEAVALASLTPRTEFGNRSLAELRRCQVVTPEQYAEAFARRLDLPYIHPHTYPLERDLFRQIPLHMFNATGQLPYLRLGDRHLLTVSPEEPSPQAAELYMRVLGYQISPAIVSTTTFDTLTLEATTNAAD
ncbi:hypothetical protein [Deinococcus multiflagellatus]|uniref:Type II secretion system protein GspE N-terminal domain-containing protein n=2 Tax=Deinococcus multiflagellatus TaxID=1656887 RepID=A0ABW1ZT08_9DEIO|nr:hypothetical protein [Deinococcus multiflagellatus]MBZ9714424.1 hypothetical protein [Deinococcus multiflagellatus]